MVSTARAGRTYVLAIIAASILISLATIIFTNLVTGWEKIGQQSIRFALTVGLCVFLYRGAAWARQTTMLLFILAGLGGVITGASLLSQTSYAALLILQGVIYLACVAALWFVPSVRSYFKQSSSVAEVALDPSTR